MTGHRGAALMNGLIKVNGSSWEWLVTKQFLSGLLFSPHHVMPSGMLSYSRKALTRNPAETCPRLLDF